MTWAVEVAARTLCQEARGEPPEGQRAVAHVLKNRLKSGHWGQNLATVCLWPYQFSGWRGPKDPNFEYACNLRDDDPLLLKMWKLMLDVLDSADDPTGGATHYVNLAIVIKKPEWIDGAPEHGIPPATHCGKFGAQDFYKNVQ
jgi:hypothetical protein